MATRVLALALAIGGFAAPVAAFAPLVTDDTGTQGKAGNQLEFSFDWDRTQQGGDSTRTSTVLLTYTRGLTDALDVYAGLSYLRIRSNAPGVGASGGGNPVVGAKWRFLEDEASKASLALRPEVLWPVSKAGEARGLGNGKTSWAITLIATQEFAFGAVHANLAAGRDNFSDPAAPANNTTSLSVAPVWNVATRCKLALDVGYASHRAAGATTRSRFAEVGAIYSPSDALDFALGVIRGSVFAAPRATTTSAIVGVTWRFP
jgi:hypothetical protein